MMGEAPLSDDLVSVPAAIAGTATIVERLLGDPRTDEKVEQERRSSCSLEYIRQSLNEGCSISILANGPVCALEARTGFLSSPAYLSMRESKSLVTFPRASDEK